MQRRRVTGTLGAAAGGLLAAAFLPMAAAFADSYEIIPDPSSTETLTGVYGLENTAPPAETGSIQGYQEFEVYDTTTNQAVGYFDADESNSTDIDGDTNTELLVTSDVPGTGTVGTAAGDVPAAGSVIDTYTYAGGEGGYVYSDLVSTTPGGADVISQTDVSPLGDYTLPNTYDAVASESGVTALPTIILGDGDEIIPADSPETFTAVSGAAPYDTDIQGTQVFDVENSAGTVIGTFGADVTTTTDAVGTTTEALLVTSDGSTGTVGTAAGDIPAVGSIVGDIDYDDGSTPEVYSDFVSPTGGADVISAYQTTLLGDISNFSTFDAVAAESDDATIPFGADSITAGGPETLTGINGLPPADVAIQGTQEFDIDNSAGTSVGSFGADVTTTSTSVYDETTETLLVTSATGDAPAVGSIIDVANYGSGFETVYSDIISTGGASVITDTMVTPFGDLAIPTTFDATSGLLADTIALF